MEDHIKIIGSALILSISYFTVWFVVSVLKKRFDVIDIAWSTGFAAVVAGLLLADQRPAAYTHTLVFALTLIWGLRLGLHIYQRNSKKSDDKRYVEMTAKWKGPLLPQVFLRIYMVQAVLLTLVLFPALAIIQVGEVVVNELVITLGAAIWAAGLAIEAVADRQLSIFLRNKPKNSDSIMNSGLWKYSRHPNYFGEVTLWWGLWVMSLAVNPIWWSVLGPITITGLILFISGIPMLERKYRDNKAYQKYARVTSVFVPWPPKKR